MRVSCASAAARFHGRVCRWQRQTGVRLGRYPSMARAALDFVFRLMHRLQLAQEGQAPHHASRARSVLHAARSKPVSAGPSRNSTRSRIASGISALQTRVSAAVFERRAEAAIQFALPYLTGRDRLSVKTGAMPTHAWTPRSWRRVPSQRLALLRSGQPADATQAVARHGVSESLRSDRSYRSLMLARGPMYVVSARAELGFPGMANRRPGIDPPSMRRSRFAHASYAAVTTTAPASSIWTAPDDATTLRPLSRHNGRAVATQDVSLLRRVGRRAVDDGCFATRSSDNNQTITRRAAIRIRASDQVRRSRAPIEHASDGGARDRRTMVVRYAAPTKPAGGRRTSSLSGFPKLPPTLQTMAGHQWLRRFSMRMPKQSVTLSTYARQRNIALRHRTSRVSNGAVRTTQTQAAAASTRERNAATPRLADSPSYDLSQLRKMVEPIVLESIFSPQTASDLTEKIMHVRDKRESLERYRMNGDR